MSTTFCGDIDTVEPRLTGWIRNRGEPDAPVRLLVRLNGRDGFCIMADRPRPDVEAAGFGGPNCGFDVLLPGEVMDGGEHWLDLTLADGTVWRAAPLGPVRAALTNVSSTCVGPFTNLLREIYDENGHDPGLVKPEAVRRSLERVDRGSGVVICPVTRGKLVGYLSLAMDKRKSQGFVRMTLLRAFWRKGIGSLMLRGAVAAASEACLNSLHLDVWETNGPARRLYEKFGFTYERTRQAVPEQLLRMSLRMPAQG